MFVFCLEGSPKQSTLSLQYCILREVLIIGSPCLNGVQCKKNKKHLYMAGFFQWPNSLNSLEIIWLNLKFL